MISTLRRIAVYMLLPGAALCSFAFGQSTARFEFSEAHMGTRFKIILYASDSEIAHRAAKAAFDRVARLDAIMSDYRETSELTGLCRKPAGSRVKLSPELFDVLSKAQEVARLSGGAFDITSGPVVRLWRRARRTGEMPDPERLKHALELTGYDKLQLDENSRTAMLKQPGMMLDLGGIAKGYAADEAMLVVKRHGIRSALVAAGGDIVVSNAPPGTRGWTIAVASVESGARPQAHTPLLSDLVLSDAAVSTSGDREQYVEIRGIRYSHIVDPRTGLGVTGQSSVTVVAPSGVMADSLATAASVLGAERGLKLIDDVRGAAALFVKASDNGLLDYVSKRWKSIPKSKPQPESLFKLNLLN